MEALVEYVNSAPAPELESVASVLTLKTVVLTAEQLELGLPQSDAVTYAPYFTATILNGKAIFKCCTRLANGRCV